VTQIYKMPIISKMVGDRDSVAIEHLYEMAPGESNSHVTDDVKWSHEGKRHVTQTGQGRDTNMLGPIT